MINFPTAGGFEKLLFKKEWQKERGDGRGGPVWNKAAIEIYQAAPLARDSLFQLH